MVSSLARRGERETRRAVYDRNRNDVMADTGSALALQSWSGDFGQKRLEVKVANQLRGLVHSNRIFTFSLGLFASGENSMYSSHLVRSRM